MVMDARNVARTAALYALTVLLVACGAIPYQSPEDVARIQSDLQLAQTPTALVPLKWGYITYGSEAGIQTENAVAVIQPGTLTLIDYKNGHYQRQAEFTTATVDCAYTFEGPNSVRPVWLLQAERGVFLGTSDDRGTIDLQMRQRLVQSLAAAGFRLHSDADGKAYQATGETDRQVVLQPGYGMRAENVELSRPLNVCR